MDFQIISEDEFKTELERLQELYTNDEPEISDQEFDYLAELYLQRFGKKFNQVGAIPRGEVEVLPYPMPSLDKIKGKNSLKDLKKFLSKFPGNKIIEEKLDGFSLLYTSFDNIQNLYTRGDGFNGQKLNHLLPYLNLPKNKKYNFAIRGELMLSKIEFENYKLTENALKSKNKLKKIRTLVNSFSTSKNNINYDLLEKCDFIAYEIIHIEKIKNGKILKLTHFEQLEFLKNNGFNIPWYKELNTDNPEKFLKKLEKYLIKRTQESNYEIDGLVINQTEETENIHKIAFKIDIIVEAEVINVEWNISSKDGKICPVVIIKELNILGSDINNISGHNARFIFDNKIGKGTKLLISLGGNIIPTIVDIKEKCEDENLIYPNLSPSKYEWNNNRVHFVMKNASANEEVKKAKISYFCKHLGIKNMGDATINTLFESGYTSLKKILKMKPEDIEDLERFGKKIAKKICTNIKNAITDQELYKIMTASCIFGQGLAESRFKEILTALNIRSLQDLKNLSEEENLVEKIMEIKGFAEITASQFATHLEEFISFMEKHKQITIKPNTNNNQQFTGEKKVIVFSDIKRDSEFKLELQNKGYEIAENVTKKTTILIVSSLDSSTNKTKLAEKYGIQILTLSQFKELY